MTLKLSNPSLFKQANLIDGQWIEAGAGPVIEVTNPATGDVIGVVPRFGRDETRRAVEAAEKAMPAWRAKTGKERAGILRKFYELMLENIEDLAQIMTAEQGKTLTESRGEIAYAASFMEWFAEEAKRVYGDIIPQNLPGRRILVQKQPIGVFAAITPWNFPAAMITRKIGPGLAVGCAGVVKPASETPFSALALGVLAEEAGIPSGVLNVVTGGSTDIGAELCENDVVRKLTFTGSTEIGALLMKQCAPTIKKLSLELGGNAPFIVFDDADIDAAVTGAIASKYRNSGQTCVCADRFYVQSGVYDEFVEKFTAAVSGLKVGNGAEEGVDLGPMINAKARASMDDVVKDATEKGASITTGGKGHALGGNFFEPTVIRDAAPSSTAITGETFGPIAAVTRFETEDEAITYANASEFGLASYFYSRDIGRVFRVSEAIEAGIVGVNEGIISTEVAPFGGVKSSGLGREGSKYGVDDFLEIKYICLGGIGG